MVVRILKRGDQGLDRVGADPAERLGDVRAHFHVRVLEGVDKRPEGAGIPGATERFGRRRTNLPVLLIAQRFDQPAHVPLGFEIVDAWRVGATEQRHEIPSWPQSDTEGGPAGRGSGPTRAAAGR